MPNSVEIVHNHLPEDFFSRYQQKNKPLLIKNAVENWPAVSLWSPDYFRQRFPNKIVEVAVSDNSYFSYSKHHKANLRIEAMRLKDAIDKIESVEHHKYYIVHQPFLANYPELKNHIDAIYEKIPLASNQVKLWLGAKDNITPLHYDMYHNFLTQICGTKTVTIFASEDSEYLYPTGIENPSNHSQIIDINNPDFKNFPQFANARALTAYLEPGDVLFIPAGWWHHVVQLTSSITLSYWWMANLDEVNVQHLFRYVATNLYKSERFEEIRNCLNFGDLKSYTEISLYFLDKQSYWLAVLFAMADLRDWIYNACSKLGIPTQNDKGFPVLGVARISPHSLVTSLNNLGISTLSVTDFQKWNTLLDVAFFEDNAKFSANDVHQMVTSIARLVEIKN